jgi:hypothetical protein
MGEIFFHLMFIYHLDRYRMNAVSLCMFYVAFSLGNTRRICFLIKCFFIAVLETITSGFVSFTRSGYLGQQNGHDLPISKGYGARNNGHVIVKNRASKGPYICEDQGGLD